MNIEDSISSLIRHCDILTLCKLSLVNKIARDETRQKRQLLSHIHADMGKWPTDLREIDGGVVSLPLKSPLLFKWALLNSIRTEVYRGFAQLSPHRFTVVLEGGHFPCVMSVVEVDLNKEAYIEAEGLASYAMAQCAENIKSNLLSPSPIFDVHRFDFRKLENKNDPAFRGCSDNKIIQDQIAFLRDKDILVLFDEPHNTWLFKGWASDVSKKSKVYKQHTYGAIFPSQKAGCMNIWAKTDVQPENDVWEGFMKLYDVPVQTIGDVIINTKWGDLNSSDHSCPLAWEHYVGWMLKAHARLISSRK